MLQQIRMMGPSGDEALEYDDTDSESVRVVKERILEEIRLGRILWGAKKGGELVKVADLRILDKAPEKAAFIEQKMVDLDRFILSHDIGKKTLAAPLVGG